MCTLWWLNCWKLNTFELFVQILNRKVKLAEMEIYPMRTFFLNILNEIISRDSKEIFMYPVDVEEVPDYLTKVKDPMDLSTMTAKVDRMEYHAVEDIELDFNLMIANCLLYNKKDTIYYKAAVRIRGFGSTIFREAKKVFDTVGYDPKTGLHLTTPPPVSIPSSESSTCKCNNTSSCNTNCKNNTSLTATPLPSVIPASFTTYRSGGDGMGSDSEGGNELSIRSNSKRDDEMEENESEPYSTYESHPTTPLPASREWADGGAHHVTNKVKVMSKDYPQSSESSELLEMTMGVKWKFEQRVVFVQQPWIALISSTKMVLELGTVPVLIEVSL